MRLAVVAIALAAEACGLLTPDYDGVVRELPGGCADPGVSIIEQTDDHARVRICGREILCGRDGDRWQCH